MFATGSVIPSRSALSGHLKERKKFPGTSLPLSPLQSGSAAACHGIAGDPVAEAILNRSERTVCSHYQGALPLCTLNQEGSCLERCVRSLVSRFWSRLGRSLDVLRKALGFRPPPPLSTWVSPSSIAPPPLYTLLEASPRKMKQGARRLLGNEGNALRHKPHESELSSLQGATVTLMAAPSEGSCDS